VFTLCCAVRLRFFERRDTNFSACLLFVVFTFCSFTFCFVRKIPLENNQRKFIGRKTPTPFAILQPCNLARSASDFRLSKPCFNGFLYAF